MNVPIIKMKTDVSHGLVNKCGKCLKYKLACISLFNFPLIIIVFNPIIFIKNVNNSLQYSLKQKKLKTESMFIYLSPLKQITLDCKTATFVISEWATNIDHF